MEYSIKKYKKSIKISIYNKKPTLPFPGDFPIPRCNCKNCKKVRVFEPLCDCEQCWDEDIGVFSEYPAGAPITDQT